MSIDAHDLQAFEDRLPFAGIFGAAERLPLLAAAYAEAGRHDAALLLRGLCERLDVAADDPLARTILAAASPEGELLRALERLDHPAGRLASARLFEQVSLRHRLHGAYWVYFRMAGVYRALGSDDAQFLAAALAFALEPRAKSSEMPATVVFAWLFARGRTDAAARLLRHWHGLFPDQPLTDAATATATLAAAGPVAAEPPRRIDRRVVEGEMRPAQDWRAYGGVPAPLVGLRQPLERRPIWISEVADAQVLIAHDGIAVLSADGVPLVDLCVRDHPDQVRAQVAGAEELALDEAVLVSDMFPPPNLAHFMLDQATRLALYRRAGIAVEQVTAIGPALLTPYQRAVAAQFGAGPWLGTDRLARLRVRRLHVSSNCRALQHAAHWGAAWALDAVRAAFGMDGAPGTRRLLLSRADAQYRRLVNEDAVAALLAAHGFERIVPGRMALEEQVAAFRAASHVVAVHGAALANIAFCPPGARVLELFPPEGGTWTYAVLAPRLRLDYASMIAAEAPAHDVAADADALLAWLRDGA